MPTQPAKPRATERDDPHRKFENAICQLQETKPLRLSQQPICSQRNALTGDLFCEKQALADAARALARLWNVYPVTIR